MDTHDFIMQLNKAEAQPEELFKVITEEGVIYSVVSVEREPHEEGSATIWLQVTED